MGDSPSHGPVFAGLTYSLSKGKGEIVTMGGIVNDSIAPSVVRFGRVRFLGLASKVSFPGVLIRSRHAYMHGEAHVSTTHTSIGTFLQLRGWKYPENTEYKSHRVVHVHHDGWVPPLAERQFTAPALGAAQGGGERGTACRCEVGGVCLVCCDGALRVIRCGFVDEAPEAFVCPGTTNKFV
jgi:hypothetical protein